MCLNCAIAAHLSEMSIVILEYSGVYVNKETVTWCPAHEF